LARLDRADSEDGTATSAPTKNLAEKIAILKERRGRYAKLSEELERTGESQISLTDPDSRAMASYPKVGVGYNAQVAVDAKHKLIVAQEVTNAGSDLGLLAQTAGAAKDVLDVARIDAVADKGYYKGEDIQACEEAGIDAYVARPQRGSAVSNGLFRKEEFATTRAVTPIFAPADSVSSPATTRWSMGMLWLTTATTRPAGPARSNRVAPRIAFGGSAVGPMKRCSTAWPNVWRRGPNCSGCGAKPSSTRSAASSNG
jgi:Transposase DDE domain